jgi:hypothetical protein
MYDAKHRFNVLSSSPDHKDRLEQSGLWERLLCDECEGRFSLWERYASQVLSGGAALNYRRQGDIVYVSGLDYTKFRLFQLSILWRSHISTLKFFEKVDLGPHAERIRVLLHAGDPGRFCRYGTLMFGVRFNGSAMKEVIIQPAVQRLDGHRAVRFVFGGFLWVFLVSSHDIVAPLAKGILQPTGQLLFLNKDAQELRDLSNFAKARASWRGRGDTTSNTSLERTRDR